MMLVNSDNLSDVLTYIASLDKASVDLETTGLNPWKTVKKRDVICGLGLYDGRGKSFYFPFSHSNSDNLDESKKIQVLDVVGRIPIEIGANYKFDLRFQYVHGSNGEPYVIDVQNGLYLMDETKVKSLKVASSVFLGDDSAKEEAELEEKLKGWGYDKGEMWRLPAHVVAPYCEKDCILAWDMNEFLNRTLSPKMKELWHELNLLTMAAFRMEKRGVPINLDTLRMLESEAAMKHSRLYLELQKDSNRQINPSSPASIAKYLGTTDAKYETLDLLRGKKPIIDKILTFKDYEKALNTYYRPYRTEWVCDDSKIRSNLNTIGARSGRWTSKDPNLQQMPRWSKEQRVKEMIEADEDYSLVEIDYSQAEIRLAAHYTQEESLIKSIWAGKDIHQFVADEAGIDRQTAKTINFATIYGAGAQRLSEQLKCSVAKAKDFLAKYDNRFPGYKQTARHAAKVAEERGYVQYWNGRRRHYTSPDQAPHTAFNQIIQGGVAQMVNRAVVRIDRELPESRMILQLHDAVYFHIPTSIVDSIVPEIKARMEDQPQFSVPMTVDVKVGKNLGAMKKYGDKVS